MSVALEWYRHSQAPFGRLNTVRDSMSAISVWLDGMGLGQYTNTFTENGVDLDVLSDLSESDLEKLGVALGHRKRILRAISDSFVSSRSNQVLLAPSQPEKRNLTVLFCDLVGSTALAVQLDPEDLSAVIRRFQAICTEVVRNNGGYVARFMGDGLLVYFGYPQAHEDEAENAVHAGLDLVARVSQLLLPSGEPLATRVGIATGVVIVGETIGGGSTQEQSAVGETLNLAARLQALAQPNSADEHCARRTLHELLHRGLRKNVSIAPFPLTTMEPRRSKVKRSPSRERVAAET
jgi:class 3 adenylate cyclase